MTMDGFVPVSKEDFEKLDIDSKLNILYDYIVAIGEEMGSFRKEKRWYKTLSFVAGFVGGFVASLTRRLL